MIIDTQTQQTALVYLDKFSLLYFWVAERTLENSKRFTPAKSPTSTRF